MKQPRLDAFEPKAAAKTNSLTSPLDDMPVIQSPIPKLPDPKPEVESEVNERSNVQTNVRSNVQMNERSEARKIIRGSFDIFAEQYLALKEIVLERERIFGRRVLLGEIVREALEQFLATERNKV